MRPRDLITEIDGVDVAPLSGEQVTRLLTGEKGSTIRLNVSAPMSSDNGNGTLVPSLESTKPAVPANAACASEI